MKHMKRFALKLLRGKKSTLIGLDKVYAENQLIVELPDDLEYDNLEDLIGLKFRYKMGDGVTSYSKLPYEKETIPVIFYQ